MANYLGPWRSRLDDELSRCSTDIWWAVVAPALKTSYKNGMDDAMAEHVCVPHDREALAQTRVALRELIEKCESYMHYHEEKFYEGEHVAGLWPAIAKARKALEER